MPFELKYVLKMTIISHTHTHTHARARARAHSKIISKLFNTPRILFLKL